MKKRIAIMLAAIMLVASLFGCAADNKATGTSSGGDKTPTESKDSTATTKTADELVREKYPEPVEIHMVLGYRDSENPDTPDSITPETQTAVKRFKEDLNIDLKYDWIVNTDQFSAKFGAEMAAGNLPDVMNLGLSQFYDLQSQGALGDLTEVYNTYANENVKSTKNFDGEIIKTTTFDNKIYGLPQGNDPMLQTPQMWYDMNKLKDAGITSYDQLPKTMADFEKLCDKLLTLDLDGNGKVGDPIMPANKWFFDAGLADFQPFFHAYGVTPKGWYNSNNDGKLTAGAINPKLKEPITKLNEWYKKGYFAKDFAAQDVWGANAPVIADIVGGKYAVMPGSWWVSNWPLNDSVKNNPKTDWVVGPALTLDGKVKTVMDRYTVSGVGAVSKDFKHPEALLKMINWAVDFSAENTNPDFMAKRTDAQKLEYDSYVYSWLPFTYFAPMSFNDNYNFIWEADKAGKTTITTEEAPKNEEFWKAWTSYRAFKEDKLDPITWGFFTSRGSQTGGVAGCINLKKNAEIAYNEVFTTTPTMITKDAELNKLRDTTLLSMIMGEKPISDFDKYAEQWNAQGGAEIQKEVTEWFAKQTK